MIRSVAPGAEGSLVGRRILVTGGTSGLGEGIARACVAAGADVAIVARDEARVLGTAAEIGAVGLPADVSDFGSISQAVIQAAEAMGGLDGLVNNASVMLHTKLAAGPPSDWAEMVAVNSLGPIYTTHAALPYLQRADFADVINISSTADATVGAGEFAVYGGTKASTTRFNEGLAKELADHDVRVVLARPGLIDTPGFGPGVRDQSSRETIEELKRRGMDPVILGAEIARVFSLDRTMNIAEITIQPGPRASGSRSPAALSKR